MLRCGSFWSSRLRLELERAGRSQVRGRAGPRQGQAQLPEHTLAAMGGWRCGGGPRFGRAQQRGAVVAPRPVEWPLIPGLPARPMHTPYVAARLCARLAAFFSRRSAARARRCLAWIFFRRESVIFGMGFHPPFMCPRCMGTRDTVRSSGAARTRQGFATLHTHACALPAGWC